MITLHRSLLAGLHHDVPRLDAVHAALQRAIELEHATIPVYLYAYFSLDATKNAEARRILKSVVVEEMLHMVLGANVLNALGGTPRVAHPDFIPTYPGHLPGGVEGQLTLHLRPFSLEQLDAFIALEEPVEPIDYERHVALAEVPAVTIGEFYQTIANAVTRLAPDSFAPSARHQVGPELMFGSLSVVDVESAIVALTTIIEQGEGTSSSPVEIDGPGGQNDFAHFYRLSELRHGRRLVSVPDAPSVLLSYEFTGDPIELDPTGVVHLPSDPRASDYANGSTARRIIDDFNATYTSLLVRLEQLVNGHNDMATFMDSLAIMSALEDQARLMTTGIENDGVPLGPSFEFRATSG